MNMHVQEQPVGGRSSGFDSPSETPQRAQSAFPSGLNFFPFSERLFESLHLGVVFQDATGHINAANAAAEQILGLTLDQMRGLHSIDPRWNAVRADGGPFPGDQHPAMVALATHLPVLDVKMGIRDLGTAPTGWSLS
jgi:PAS domain-containing protein